MSQVSKFERCARRWYFGKVLHQPEPGSPATELGVAVHSCLENWFSRGVIECTDAQITDEDVKERAVEIATFAVESGRLPPRTGRLLLTEESVELSLADVPVEGYVDLLDITDPQLVQIWDYKTRSRFQRTGNFRNILTPEDLARDVQMMTYAAAMHRKYKAAAYQLTHVYLRTQGKPAIELTTTIVTPDQFAAVLGPLTDTVRAMSACAAVTDVSQVQPNYDACNDYRRPCPYIAQCLANTGRFHPPAEVTEELSTMSLSEKVAAHKAASRTTTQTVPAQPPAATSSTPPPTTGESTGTAVASEYVQELAVYVDCLPVKGVSGNVVRLEDEIETRTREILAAVAAGTLRVENLPANTAASIVDLREVKYGCGTTALCASFKRRPPTGNIVVRNGSVGLSALVLEVLRPIATRIIEPLG